jgi:putative heme iron utilization protein
MSSSIGKHAGPATVGDHPPIPEPSLAERARTLLHVGRIGSFSTLSRKQAGFPFGSLMPYGLDDRGRPSFLISTMAMHTQNLKADPRASLLVTLPAPSGEPLDASRITVVGNGLPVQAPEVAQVREMYLARHPSSKYWVDFEDFAFFRMDVVDVYYVGGFGVMGWIAAAEYEEAKTDPLSDSANAILEHMNADHKDALILLVRVFAGLPAEEATMTRVDRLGFHVSLKTADGMKGARIPFLREVSSAAETRQVLVEMVHQARSRP